MGKFFFKYRGAFFIPLAIILIVFGKPSILSLFTGFLIALSGEVIRIWGVGFAGSTTRKNTVSAPFLVTAGPYSFVRNPLYLGNSITGLGFTIIACGKTEFTTTALLLILWVIVYSGVYGIIIPYEEQFLLNTFGQPYQYYLSKVPRIIPNLHQFDKAQGKFCLKTALSSETITLLQFFLLTIIMYLKLPDNMLFERLFFS